MPNEEPEAELVFIESVGTASELPIDTGTASAVTLAGIIRDTVISLENTIYRTDNPDPTR